MAGLLMVGLLMVGLGLLGCSADYTTFQGQTMGTYYLVRYDSAECELRQTEVEIRLAEINSSMSTYDAASEVSKFNNGGVGRYEISDDFKAVINTAKSIHEITSGALDVTVGPLVELWGFGAKRQASPPSEAEQLKAAQTVGMSYVLLKGNTLFKNHPATRLDLSAVAKGYAVDALAQRAQTVGCANYMVDIGGEISVAGMNPNGDHWRLGIEVPDPGQVGATQQILELTNSAVATSGDYRNFRLVDGIKIAHVFDPRLGKPAPSSVISATVIHHSAMIADGYATAFMVLSANEGLALANKQNLAVFLMVRAKDSKDGYDTVYNAAMQPYLVLPNPT